MYKNIKKSEVKRDPYCRAYFEASVAEVTESAITNRDADVPASEEMLGRICLSYQDACDNYIGFLNGKPVILDYDKYMTGTWSDFIDEEGKALENYSFSAGATDSIMCGDYLDSEEANPLFIVEGPINMLIIEHLGQAALSISTKDVGALLAKFDKFDLDCFEDRVFIIDFDNDTEGQNASKLILSGLTERGLNVVESRRSQRGLSSFYKIIKDEGESIAEDLIDKEVYIANKRISTLKQARNEIVEEMKERRSEIYDEHSAKANLDNFIDALETDNQVQPVQTGFNRLDEIFGGGLYNELYILGAIPGLGKTSFALQIADYIAKGGRNVVFFSLEMQPQELIARSLSRLSYINMSPSDNEMNAFSYREISLKRKAYTTEEGLKYRGLNVSETSLFEKAVEQYEGYSGSIHFFSSKRNVRELKETVQDLCNCLDDNPVVIIDYLQKLAPIENQDVSDKSNMDMTSYVLREMCGELGVPVFAISSLNRSGYFGNKGAGIFKESGGLEYMGDVLMSMGIANESDDTTAKDVEEELRKNPRQLGIRVIKNRHGETGDVVIFDFTACYSYFVETGKKTWSSNKEETKKKRTNRKRKSTSNKSS